MGRLFEAFEPQHLCCSHGPLALRNQCAGKVLPRVSTLVPTDSGFRVQGLDKERP